MPTVNLPVVEASHDVPATSATNVAGVESPLAKSPQRNEPNVGARLKMLREAYGFSQRELAKRAGITNSNISMIEQEQVSPSIQSLVRILNAFPIALADFFSWDLTQCGTFVYSAAALHKAQRTDAAGVLIQALAQDNPARQLDMQVQSFPAGFVGALKQNESLADWCGLVTQGRLQLLVGAKLYELSIGDGFYIPHGLQFRCTNPSTELASIVSCSFFVRGV